MKLLLTCLLAFSCNAAVIEPKSPAPVAAIDTVSVQSYHYIWKYKYENGVAYARRWCVETGKWVGDWIII